MNRIVAIGQRAKIYSELSALIAENPDILTYIASDLASYGGDVDHALSHYNILLLDEHEPGSHWASERQIFDRFMGKLRRIQ